MGNKKCRNCNEVISRYELLQELHRRDQDSEEIIETINDMTAKGTIKGLVILASSELSKSEISNNQKRDDHAPIKSSIPPMATPIVVVVDITPMSGTGVPMSPNSTRFLATLEPVNCDRLGITSDYVIDIGEKHVILRKDGSKITDVSVKYVDR